MSKLGYVFGLLMVFDGLLGTISPTKAMRIWRNYISGLLPRSINRIFADYAQLSDKTIRFQGVYILMSGLLVLALSDPRRVHAPEEWD
jgi:uncharacterized protein YjeT (DUF2065 family)